MDSIDVHGGLLSLTELAQAFSGSLEGGAEAYRLKVLLFAEISFFSHGSDNVCATTTMQIFHALDLVSSKFLLTQRNAFLTEAACYLIAASISPDGIVSRKVSTQTAPYWQSVIDHAIKHYNSDVHAAAALAMSSLSKIKDCSYDVKR